MPIGLKNAELQQIVSYTIPKLYTGKEWYIGFYSFNPVENKLKIKRIKLNHIAKVSERRKYAADLMNRLNEQLRKGWNPWIASEDSKSYTTFSEACENYIRLTTRYYNDNIIREDTYKSYMSYLRNLRNYNQDLKIPITYIYQLNRGFLNEFLEYIYIERENSSQTRDNYLGWLKIFAKFLLKQGYHKTNEAEGIEVLGKRSRKKTRTTISPADLERLRVFVDGQNKHYLLACYILFYCFIRPKEMSKIKVGNISLVNRTIFISEENSKNRRDAIVTLNKKIIDLMLDLEIFNSPSSFYLFGKNFKPGEIQYSEKQFRDFWLRFVRDKLKFPETYKFYSLKDTGVTLMLRNRIDNISVRDQARHSSILMTDTYTPHDIAEANPIIEKFDTIF